MIVDEPLDEPGADAGALGHRARGDHPRDLSRTAGAERRARRHAGAGSCRAAAWPTRRATRPFATTSRTRSRWSRARGWPRSSAQTRFEVNSFHHQAVKRLGRGLKAVGWSPDGVIEAMESTEHPWLLAVQFHPENLVASARAEPSPVRGVRGGLRRALAAAPRHRPLTGCLERQPVVRCECYG